MFCRICRGEFGSFAAEKRGQIPPDKLSEIIEKSRILIPDFRGGPAVFLRLCPCGGPYRLLAQRAQIRKLPAPQKERSEIRRQFIAEPLQDLAVSGFVMGHPILRLLAESGHLGT